MARGRRKQEVPAKAESGSGEDQKPKDDTGEVRYPLETYLDNARPMLGTTRYALIGALHGQEEPEGGYTKSELKALLDTFSNRPLT